MAAKNGAAPQLAAPPELNFSTVWQIVKQNTDASTARVLGQELKRYQQSIDLKVPERLLRQEVTSWASRRESESFFLAGNNLGKNGKLTYDQIERMRLSGPVRFVLAMKKMPIVSLFKKQAGTEWWIATKDEKRKLQLEAIFDYVRLDFIRATLNYLEYGFSPFERVYKRFEPNELGLEDSGPLWGYAKLKDLYPPEITLLFKENSDEYKGFEQRPTGRNLNPIRVSAEKTLIMTHNKEYGNLYGESDLTPMYVPWFWHEVVSKSMLRYMERVGTPVVVVYAPRQHRLTSATSSRAVDAMKFALSTAINAGKSNAIALPSDLYPGTNHPMWRIEYLQDQQRSTQFTSILNYLNVQIMRAGLVPERSSTQNDEMGSNAMAQTHYDVFLQSEDLLLAEILSQINNYLIKPIVQFNYGDQTQAQINTADLDRTSLDRAFNLMSAIVNVHPDVPKIDLGGLSEMLGLPWDEEAESFTEIEEQKSEDAFAKSQEIAKQTAKLAPPAAAKKPPAKMSFETDELNLFEILTESVVDEIRLSGVERTHKDAIDLFIKYCQVNPAAAKIAKRLADAAEYRQKALEEILHG